MKNIIVVTGGAGFIGSNLIEYLIKKTKLNIISIDDYSTGSKTEISVDCNSPVYQIPGSDVSKEISGIGYFELPQSCIARHKSIIIRPATRNLEHFEEKIEPLIKLKIKPFANFKQFIKNIKLDLKPSNIPRTIWKSYITPLIIAIVGVIVAVIIGILVFYCTLCNPCGRICCLSAMTRYSKYEIAVMEQRLRPRKETEMNEIEGKKWPEPELEAIQIPMNKPNSERQKTPTPPPFPVSTTKL